VADMMVANAKNLVVTIKPANQRNSLQRNNKMQKASLNGSSSPFLHQMTTTAAQFDLQNHQSYPNHPQQYPMNSAGPKLMTNGGGGRVYPSSTGMPMGVYQPANLQQNRRSKYSDEFDDEEDGDEDEVVDHTKNMEAMKIR
jgi:hypothetical protein